jgi:carotenoid cleavage dioxygenase
MPSPIETMIRKTVTKGMMAVAAFNRARIPAPEKPHPFLSGIHEPMRSELTLEALQVKGNLPAGLDGTYVRIGPNPVKPPNPAAYHWFLGDGMVHGVRLKDGKALWYRNRWIRSNAVSQALGEEPAPGPRNFHDTVNTNVLGHAGKTWALVEAGGYPVELDGELRTVAHNPFEGTLKGAFSAHPHLDPVTGELHAICYLGSDLNALRHVVVTRDGKVRRQERIAVSHGPSVHDCMITAKYVLVFDLPVTFSMQTLLGGHPFPYAWNPAHKARIGLLPREGRDSDIVWCDVDPCYVFHAANAYEDADGSVILDVAAHDSMFAQSRQGPDSGRIAFERWRIDPQARRVARKVVDDIAQEFPRCDERLLGKPYRYAYTMAVTKHDDEFLPGSQLIRHDLQSGTRAVHELGAQRYPGEFVFVPAQPGAAEDEGWLMGYVVDAASGTTELVILDARNFSGPPVASVVIPHRVPAGFHGNWVPASRG